MNPPPPQLLRSSRCRQLMRAELTAVDRADPRARRLAIPALMLSRGVSHCRYLKESRTKHSPSPLCKAGYDLLPSKHSTRAYV